MQRQKNIAPLRQRFLIEALKKSALQPFQKWLAIVIPGDRNSRLWRRPLTQADGMAELYRKQLGENDVISEPTAPLVVVPVLLHIAKRGRRLTKIRDFRTRAFTDLRTPLAANRAGVPRQRVVHQRIIGPIAAATPKLGRPEHDAANAQLPGCERHRKAERVRPFATDHKIGRSCLQRIPRKRKHAPHDEIWLVLSASTSFDMRLRNQ